MSDKKNGVELKKANGGEATSSNESNISEIDIENYEQSVLLNLLSKNIEKIRLTDMLAMRLSLVTILCAFTTVISIVFAAFVYTSSAKKEPRYFTKNAYGEYYEIRSLDQPSFEDAWVSQYAVEALVRTFSFSFSDYKLRLDDAYKKYYTAAGRDSLQQRLESTGILRTLIQNELFFSMSITEAPLIQKTGVKDGQFIWEVHTRGVLTYRNSKGTPSSQKIKIRCWVVQVDTADFPSGMAIESLQWLNDDSA